jgi:excisionase family DNA binding protein
MKALSTVLKDPPPPVNARRSEFMSVPEASEFLSIHRNTLYKLIAEGEIPAFRLTTGGRWKFRRSDLEDWLTDRQARSAR